MSDIDYELLEKMKSEPNYEVARQYYFMGKCREYFKALSEKLGRPLFCATITFGCQMNARDSEKLSGILKEIGFVETESENADFVIYNTCTVRENANNRCTDILVCLEIIRKRILI